MDYRQKFQNLCNWVVENGGFVNKNISIEDTQFGRSIISNGEIHPDEILISIPSNLLLNNKNIELNINSDVLNEKMLTCICLLIELKKEDSFWEHYIELLPVAKEFENHPIFLSLSNKLTVEFESINNEINLLLNELSFLIKFIQKNNLFEEVLVEEIIWSYLIVTTRMWTGKGLVPIADIFQHRNDSKINLDNFDSDMIGMKTPDLVMPNQTIYDNYNTNDDLQLYTNFGFIDDSGDCRLKLEFEENKVYEINERAYLSSRTFRYENLYFTRVSNLSSDDIIQKKYQRPLDSEKEILSVKSLISKIQGLNILKDINRLKHQDFKITSEITDLMYKLDMTINYNVNLLKEKLQN